MKKKLIILAILILSLAHAANAQNLIAVQNGGEPTFFTNLDSAFVYAQNGDTIYLPGGIFPINQVINKDAKIVGVGFNSDSTSATGRTIIGNQITYIVNGAENGSFIGIYFTGAIYFGSPGDSSTFDIDNFTINSCYFSDINFVSSLPNNNVFIGNIIRGIDGNRTMNNSFFNNFIHGQVKYFSNNNIFRNNVFTYVCSGCYSTSALLGIDGCSFSNNIFVNSFFSSNLIYQFNIFLNNINALNGLFGYYTNNSGTNNYTGVSPSEIFQNYSGGGFNFNDDYHLLDSDLYIGVDGTQVGIYGGAFPWKEGSIPFNPHFQAFDISPVTDSTGLLNVNIQVEAQDY